MAAALNPIVAEVTHAIEKRSAPYRQYYLNQVDEAIAKMDGKKAAGLMDCSNLAHVLAAEGDKQPTWPIVAITTAYNDMVSAHAPYGDYPEKIKRALRELNATAKVAGGTGAMCDGVTQGAEGMELSLFSRDHIAGDVAIALSHQAFDAHIMLGICDKIVPGLIMGALSAGKHLPTILLPSGPMKSGTVSNKQKSDARGLYTNGKISREELLEQYEQQAYHSAGTCTFYGTANSNQMLMQILGLHEPGAAFINPGTDLREALTRHGAQRSIQIDTPIGKMLSVESFVNGMIGLLATGGSTNHTMHLPAMAKRCGIILKWRDFDLLSKVVPLMANVYPNGDADINHFQDAGGIEFIIGDLLRHGLLHRDVKTVFGTGMEAYNQEAIFDDNNRLVWRPVEQESPDRSVLRGVDDPFRAEGGIREIVGKIGGKPTRAIMKTSSVPEDGLIVEAPVRVFNEQADVIAARKRGDLNMDVIVVVRFQGPRANGMPELHKLIPELKELQKAGYKVGLVGDFRLSGASGAIPSVVHVVPEAAAGGWLARVRDGDIMRIDGVTGKIELKVDTTEFDARKPIQLSSLNRDLETVGRDLFGHYRKIVSRADTGATIFPMPKRSSVSHGAIAQSLATAGM